MTDYRHDDYASEFKRRAPVDWARAVAFARGKGPLLTRPYQVEIHPSLAGNPPCLMSCVDCHGRFLRIRDGLPERIWLTLLDDLKTMDIPSLVISGAYSDPTVSEDLILKVLDRSGPTWGVKLHTYGYGLTGKVREAIVRAAKADPSHDSYVTISKVTTNHYVYRRMCCPPSPALASLDREQENLTRFFFLVKNTGTPLTVRLNCRVTRINGDPRHLAELLRWLENVPDFVHLRFTSDYVPSYAPQGFQDSFLNDIYLSPGIVQQSIQTAMDLAKFEHPERISFRDTEQTDYIGNTCYNSLLLAAVATGGLVFPCQGIASARHPAPSYGDLKSERFSDIWGRFVESWASTRRCSRCIPACERQINAAMSEEVQH